MLLQLHASCEFTYFNYISQGGDIERATDWIFSNPDASSTCDMDTTGSSCAAASVDADLPDGPGS